MWGRKNGERVLRVLVSFTGDENVLELDRNDYKTL